MRIAICDDSAEDRRHCRDYVGLVAKDMGVRADIREFDSANKLIMAVGDSAEEFDILILDIMMPGTDGIAAAREMRQEGLRSQIIYLTRSAEHAISAFDVGAVNYVLKEDIKDVSSGRFERAFRRAVSNYLHANRECLLLNGVSEHRNIPIEDITYFEVKYRTCIAHYGLGETFEFMSTIRRLSLMMEPYGFTLTHRSFLVCASYIRKITAQEVTLFDGTKVPLSRKYRSSVIKLLEDMAAVHVRHPKSQAVGTNDQNRSEASHAHV